MATKAQDPRCKSSGAESQENPTAEAETPAVEHPRRLHPRKRGHVDRMLRPDRYRGGFDTK